MIALRLALVALLSLSFISCATTPSGPPPVLAKLQALGIDSRTYAKIANHRVLSYNDIYGLVVKKVPSQVILTYIQSTHAPYTFTDHQLNHLVSAGAKPDLINYLGKSVGYFEATERSQTGGSGKWKNDPFFADPYFMGDAPFAYGYPPLWYNQEWMDGVF